MYQLQFQYLAEHQTQDLVMQALQAAVLHWMPVVTIHSRESVTQLLEHTITQ